MTTINEIKAVFSNDDMIELYNMWEDLHNYILNLEEIEINEKHLEVVLSKFRSSCSKGFDSICRTIRKDNGDKIDCKVDCPISGACLESGSTGHILYCEIAGACARKDVNKFKELIKSIPVDSLNNLKDSRDLWSIS